MQKMGTHEDVSSGVVGGGGWVGREEDFVGAPEDCLESHACVLVDCYAILEHPK